MRMPMLVVLLLAQLAFSREKAHEIGWEEGLRYSRHFGSFSIGARLTPEYNYSEGGQDPVQMSGPSSYSSNSSSRNSESRSLQVGMQIFKHYKYSDMIYFEPFTEVGYIYRRTEENSHSSYSVQESNPGVPGETRVSTEASTTSGDVAYTLLGIKPGILVKERIKIYTRLGVDFSLSHSKRNGKNHYERIGGLDPRSDSNNRNESFLTWNFDTFGYSSLVNGIFVSLLF